jgi:ribosomal protein S18 acetylase RimI-like enzyme
MPESPSRNSAPGPGREAAASYGDPVSTVSRGIEVVRVSPGVHWHALEDDVVVGRGYGLHRPDGRVLVSADTWRDDVFEVLAETMAKDLGGPVFTVVDEDDREHLGRWSALGFVDHRREDEFVVPTDPAVTGLDGAVPPPGYDLVGADAADEDRLRELDDRIRGDVPGSAGWVSSPEAFHAAVYDPRWFDPATHLVAVRDGAYAGLVRVAGGRRLPRLGLVGVLPGHRRRGLARSLLAAAFRPLHERGVTQVGAEADATNEPSQALLRGIGATRTGGAIELVRL